MPPMPPMGGMMPEMPMQPMGQPMMPPMQPMRDPLVDIAQMQSLIQQTTPAGPIYPAWFTPPSRPNASKIEETALRRFDEYSVWRAAVRFDLMLLRMAEAGVYDEDKPGVLAKIMEEYQSTGLVDEFNLAVSFIGGLKRRITKKQRSDELKTYTRKVKLSAEWMMDVEAHCHTDKGEMSTNILEPKLLLAYGRIVKRRVLDRFAEPYYSPFLTDYIDPAQVVAEDDNRPGPARIYRVFSARVRELAESYGDFAPSQRKKLEDRYGKFEDDMELTNIVEYWDRWWRCVSCSGAEIIPVTEHKYGEVPFTIGLGPLGEPAKTRLPEESGAASMSAQTFRDSLPFKSVGFTRFRSISHLQHEAFMTRILFGVKRELWPPYVRMRSAQAALNPAPPLDGNPGAANEGIMGEEEFVDFPVPRSSPMDRQALTQALERDRMTGSTPLSAYGHMDQSNISGTANKQAVQAGMHLWKPWVDALESFNGRDITKGLRIWQRLGHAVEYAQDQRRPFVVPVPKPYKGEAGSFELDKTVIDKVGPDVGVTMSSVNPDEWLLRTQTAQAMFDVGFSLEYTAPHLFGIEYDQQMFEEWQEAKAIRLAMEHPKFLELEMIPTMLLSEAAEAEGDPDLQDYLAMMHQRWEELVVAPAQMEQDMKMQEMQATPGPGEAVPSGQPPTTEGVSLPEMGQGPGSVSGNQGGPQGPTGPRHSPAEGS
jgi:hypothetical protein